MIDPAQPTPVLGTALTDRRRLLQGTSAGALLWCLGGPRALARGLRPTAPLLGFLSIPPSTADRITVPPGYSAQVLFAWGDPIQPGGPAWKPDASNTAEDQKLQAGMHHDGMHYFPLDGSRRGLLAINHEYVDDWLLHTSGKEEWTAPQVQKAQAAHGVSIVEVEQDEGTWRVVESAAARRITAHTPMRASGPAAGSDLLKTQADPTGQWILGTFGNCAAGQTPWGTFLTCEENVHEYFQLERPEPELSPAEKRYKLGKSRYEWHPFDERFDAGRHPNEPHRFGWVVEIDPADPKAVPVKRTALGRFAHENAMVTLARDGRVVVYLADDAQFEHIYKFVSRDRFDPKNPRAQPDLLDHGTLYVARFDAGDVGRWIALTQGKHGLDQSAGFASQADVVVKARLAATQVGATRMDRPEWIAVHPERGEVFVTLTNNRRRGEPGGEPDPANPRTHNVYGHILRWSESMGDAAATTFRWSVFLLCGDRKHADPNKRGTIRSESKDGDFGSPDGLWVDGRGVVWIQTDVSTEVLGRDDYERLGNNQMLAADPGTGEVRRFLTGPKGCEVTGITATPDGETLFVNIQHPGEPAEGHNDPRKPGRISMWPGGTAVGRPRSATVVIRKDAGGVVGA